MGETKIAENLHSDHNSEMELLLLTWTEEYAVGHQGLDAEHQQLMKIINTICHAENAEYTPEQLSPLLKTLTLATVAHFKHENSVMREFGSRAAPFETERPAFSGVMSVDAINEHCAEHARALLRLEAIIQAVGLPADCRQEHLGRTLIEWFTEHAIGHDVELKTVFQDYLMHL